MPDRLTFGKAAGQDSGGLERVGLHHQAGYG